GVKRGHDMLRYVDARLSSGGSVLDQGATLLDAYAFVFFLWGLRAQLPVTKLENYKRLAQAQVERPAVLRALKEEGLDQVPELIRALSSQDNVAFSGPS